MNKEPNAKPASTQAGFFAPLFALLRSAGSSAPAGFRAPTPNRRAGRVPVVLCGLAAALALTLTAPSAQAETCPNEAIRQSQGALAKALPDCRAYELVSPGSNPMTYVGGDAADVRASTTGNRFAYKSNYPAANAQTASFFYLAIRGTAGWSTEPVTPQDSTSASILSSCNQELNYSPDLFKSVLGDGLHAEPYCQSADEELAPGAPSDYRNLFLREDATVGSYRLLNLTPEAAVPGDALFVAGSTDFSHIVFTDAAQLTPNAPLGASLYEWADGAVQLVTVLPDGKPAQGGIVGSISTFESFAQAQHAVSTDGERVYFYSQGNLYLRQNATQQPSAGGECTPAEPEKACTVQIDESHGPGDSGGGEFGEASADGSRVFFTDQSRLTGDSTAEPGKSDLYEYNTDTGQLTDLTPNAPGAGFFGAGEEGSYVYFTSPGVLTGAQENEHHETAQLGRPNLYMRHGPQTTFVAGFQNAETGQVAPNGRFLVFTSRESLTGYDNNPVDPAECRGRDEASYPGPCTEIFRYEADTGQLSCASCGPEGSAPMVGTFLARAQVSGEETPAASYRPRNVLDDGRVFFDTKNALVPEDENGTRDVYEYANGQIHLISSGTDPSGAVYADASPSDDDVFILTGQRLLPLDTNNNNSVYDARAEGGFAEPPPPPECEGEACRVGGTVAAASAPTATANFNAPGNPPIARCRAGFLRRRGRCVKKARHHANKHRSHKPAANANRRTSR